MGESVGRLLKVVGGKYQTVTTPTSALAPTKEVYMVKTISKRPTAAHDSGHSFPVLGMTSPGNGGSHIPHESNFKDSNIPLEDDGVVQQNRLEAVVRHSPMHPVSPTSNGDK
jgi:hypothetical protein